MSILSIFKTPQRKKSKRGALIKALDDFISLQVRERDGHRCRKCGRERRFASDRTRVFHHHIFTKSRLSTRWDLKNGVTLCFHCHRWAHSAGEEFREWVISWMPVAEYDALYIRSQMRGTFHDCDLEWMLKDMRRAA